jgi:uncharacterized protein
MNKIGLEPGTGDTLVTYEAQSTQGRFFFMKFISILSLLIFALLASSISAKEVSITLEVAQTHEQRAWGLMGRHSMPENHGMLFYYPKGFIWMFNTWMDLSLAFLDKQGIIIEIADLKAYPEMMDRYRPIRNLKDLEKYPCYDAVYQFFWNKRHPVPSQSEYALEMNKGWFTKNDVKPGDKVSWNTDSSTASIKQSHFPE